MEITKFRVKNYRSIIDSGDCYLSPNITVLAGQNEAGKTSILQALEDFSQSKDIRDEAIPIDREAKPVISVTFSLGEEDLNGTLPDSISGIPNEKMREVTISKTGNAQYEVENVDSTFPELSAAKDDLISDAEDFIEQAVARINSDNTFGTYSDKKKDAVDQRLSSLQRYLENSLK